MIYIILFIVSFGLTYFIKNYAIKKSLVAEVNERSSHSIPTPYGGGIAVAVTWFIGISYLFYINEIDKSFYYALMVGIVISVVSYFDDLFELSVKVRLVAQAFVAGLGLYFLGGLQEIDFGLFSVTNQFLTNGFAFLLIVWFINLYNFLDGINGYAGSEALFLSLAGFILFGGSHFLVLAVAVLGFLYWNFGNAKIFMGDVGSTLLGYTVAVFTLYYANVESANLWVWIILFGVFWFDATVTLIRRKLNGEQLSQAHKKHAYQCLTQAGWSHTKVVIASLFVNILLFCFVYGISNVFIAFVLAMVVLCVSMFFVEKQKVM